MGYLSLIFVEAKFGAPTRISKANFGAKPNMEVPPWGDTRSHGFTAKFLLLKMYASGFSHEKEIREDRGGVK